MDCGLLRTPILWQANQLVKQLVAIVHADHSIFDNNRCTQESSATVVYLCILNELKV